MTQRLSTKIGTQGGLETNLQADQSQGYQIADNVIYRPIGGLSKRRGSKKLVASVSGETKRLLSPTQAADGVLSIQEVDSTGEAKVLGYKEEGVRVDLYSQEGTSKVLLNPDSAFTPYDKIRIDFDLSIYSTYYSFIEDAFEDKIGVFGDGFFAVQTTFTTVAVEQDSADFKLLRVPRFVNLPTKENEIDISNPFSLGSLGVLTDWDIVSVSATYFTIYPNSSAPAWTSVGNTGTIDITFNTCKVIDVNENAISSQALTSLSDNKVFYEVRGTSSFDSLFTSNQTRIMLEDRSGDEIVFNSDPGQVVFIDENPDTPRVSYYGSEPPLDCVPYYFTNYTNALQYGSIKEQTVYAYRAVTRKTLNNQSFVSAPSPIFYFETPDESANYNTISGANIGLTADNQIFINTLNTDAVSIQLKNVTSTPAIPDGTQFKIKDSFDGSGIAYISIDQQIAVLGAQVTAISQADIFENRMMFCDVILGEEFWREAFNNLSNTFVDIYRTQGVSSGSIPDISQFFLVKSVNPPLGETPQTYVLDNNITDFEIESQLPLYTNNAEEGVLKANDLAPQHQTFIEKNGVFYLGDLKKKEIATGSNTLIKDQSIFDVRVVGFNYSTRVTRTPTNGPANSYFTYIWKNLTDTIPSDLGLNTNSDVRYFSLMRPITSSQIVLVQNGTIYRPGVVPTPLVVSDYVMTPLFNYQFTETETIENISGSTLTYHLTYRCINANIAIGFDELDNFSGLSGVGKSAFLSPIYTLWNNTPFSSTYNLSFKKRFFNPSLSTGVSDDFLDESLTVDFENFRYQIAYSKPFEPAAFPPLQFLNVGSTKNIIYGIFSVRDSLIVASKEGFYRLTGDNELDYSLTAIERDTTPLTPLLMTEQQDRVYSLTQKGLAACSESDLQIIDAPIQDLTERFLQLYRDDLDTLTVKQTYTAGPRFLNQIVFYLPTLKERDTSVSRFGISYDTTYQRFSTVDLYAEDDEKTGVISSSFDSSRFSISSYSAPSFEPSSLQSVRAAVNRADFAQNESFISLRSELQATGSLTAGSSILTVTTTLDHRLTNGDYVTIVSGSAFVGVSTGYTSLPFSEAVYAAIISTDSRVFSVDLGTASGATLSDDSLTFRYGRNGLPALLSVTAGSVSVTLTFTNERDVGWQVGQAIYIVEPQNTSLVSITTSLSNEHLITSVAANSLTFDLPTASPSTFTNEPVIFSEKLTGIQRRAFSFVAKNPFDSTKDYALLYRNDALIYPFESEDKGTRIQGFLERPLDQQAAPDRPSKVYDGVKSTLMTSRITGGDPCSLKNFSQFILTMQSIFSLTKLNISFQGDRFDAVDGIVFRSQSILDQSFDPAFGDAIWSTILQQWDSITNPNFGWKESGPFTPVRITIPTSVAQSTYLSVFLRHSRPFETFALGSIAVNGVFIDPTSSGV